MRRRHFLRCFALSLAIFLFSTPGFGQETRKAKEGILLVAFGTSVPEAKKSFDAIDKAYKAEFPDTPIAWAFTSQIIRKKLAKRGIHTGSIADGLATLAKEGVKICRVQSLHMMAGREFASLARSVLLDIQKHPGRFEAVYLGRPLLETAQDADIVADAILAYMKNRRKNGEALVLMGHGNGHGRADLVFEGLRSRFRDIDSNVFLATVEGGRGLDQVKKEMAKAGVKRAILAPLMIVAGDHARNDLAGDEEESWASQLKASGMGVDKELTGLGEIPGIAQLFTLHTRSNQDNLCLEPVKP